MKKNKFGKTTSPTPPQAVAPSTLAVNHSNTFRGTSFGFDRIYRNLDEATKISKEHARAMRRDLTIMQPIFSRQIAAAQLNDSVIPCDPRDSKSCEAAVILNKIIKSIPRWTEYKRNLLECIWYGRHTNLNNFSWDFSQSDRRLLIDKWLPINGDKNYFANDGKFGYFCRTPTGLRDVGRSADGMVEFFDEEDLQAITHSKYHIIDADMDEHLFAGHYEGVGLRNWIYFTWKLRMDLLGYLTDTLQRYSAGGIVIGTYEMGNPESESKMTTALQNFANGDQILLVPRPPGTEKATTSVEVLSPSNVSLDYFVNLIDNVFSRDIRRLITGSDITDITTESSDILESEFQRILKYDAEILTESVNHWLLPTLVKYNFPETKNINVQYAISVEKSPGQINNWLTAVQRVYEIGVPISEQQVREYAGLEKPEFEEDTVEKKSEEKTIKTPRIGIGNLGDQLS